MIALLARFSHPLKPIHCIDTRQLGARFARIARTITATRAASEDNSRAKAATYAVPVRHMQAKALGCSSKRRSLYKMQQQPARGARMDECDLRPP